MSVYHTVSLNSNFVVLKLEICFNQSKSIFELLEFSDKQAKSFALFKAFSSDTDL